MTEIKLAERQRAVLRALAEREESYAFQVADALVEAGLQPCYIGRGYANGAANTLVALRRRGYVEKSWEGGCFIQAKWRLIPLGRAALNSA